MIELIIGILIIVGIIWLIVKVVVPLVGIISMVALGIGAVGSLIAALVSYIKAIAEHANPYYDYTDHSRNKQPARRSYFFGPGMLQLGLTIKDAWCNMFGWVAKVTEIALAMFFFFDAWWMKLIMFFPAAAFALASYISIIVVGGCATLALSAAHAGIVLGTMVVIYIVFCITWLVDYIYLKIHSIRTSCPYCQEQYVIPIFECSSCQRQHTKLIPGPYGVFRRKCTCGKKLPTTFFTGRSKLTAYCPNPRCGNELAASDAQQVAISVVGGSSSGKTVLLSAFYHSFFELLGQPSSQVSVEIPKIHAAIFEDMESWYQGAACAPTAVSDTSTMYSVLLESKLFDARKQFSIYDIAGEAFRDPTMSAMIPQKQFKHANGIILVIDPLASSMMRSEAEASGDDIENYSEAEAATVITNFVTYLKNTLTTMGVAKTIQKPVSVVITKADLSAVKRRISYTHIRHEVRQGNFPDFDTARDALCQQFLSDIGLYSVVQAVTAAFQNVHYYPVSAIGHEPDGEAYEPEHVLEPFANIIATEDSALAEVTGLSAYAQPITAAATTNSKEVRK